MGCILSEPVYIGRILRRMAGSRSDFSPQRRDGAVSQDRSSDPFPCPTCCEHAGRTNDTSGNTLQVIVRDNNVEQALRALKKKLQREGVFREMKARRSYEKPSEKRARQKAEAVRRARKLARKQAQREGLLPAPKRKPQAARPGRPAAPSASAA